MKILGFKLVFGHKNEKRTVLVEDHQITVKGNGVDKIYKPSTPMVYTVEIMDDEEHLENTIVLKPRLMIPVKLYGSGFTEDCQVYMGDGVECKMAEFGAGDNMSNPNVLIMEVVVYAEVSNGLKQLQVHIGNESYKGKKFINPDITIRVIEARPNTVTAS